MSNRFRLVALLALPALTACLPDATLETDAQKASYGIGMNIGRSMADIEEHVDMVAVIQGVTDALSEAEPALTQQEIEAAMVAFEEIIQADARERGSTEGAAFLEENAGRDGVIITESGLHYEVLREGDGASPESGQLVVVNYRGMLPDGTEFDSSYSRGEPSTFDVDGVIAGFSEALKLMKVGGQIRAVIPSELGYRETGNPRIGPNQVLIFEIELVGIKE